MPTAPRSLLRVVNAGGPTAGVAGYLSRVRWRCDVDPDWEIDTRHPGFKTWRGAACFANGLTEEGASTLLLREGALFLRLVNGRVLPVNVEEIVVWQRVRSTGGRDDARFMRAAAGPSELSACGLDGALSPMRFGVDEARGGQRLDVRVEAHMRRRAVVVSLDLPRDEDANETTPFGRQLFQPAQA
jgi:hypothetical protein